MIMWNLSLDNNFAGSESIRFANSRSEFRLGTSVANFLNDFSGSLLNRQKVAQAMLDWPAYRLILKRPLGLSRSYFQELARLVFVTT